MAATGNSGLQSAILLEDIFDVVKINPDGKKFERGEGLSRVGRRARAHPAAGSRAGGASGRRSRRAPLSRRRRGPTAP